MSVHGKQAELLRMKYVSSIISMILSWYFFLIKNEHKQQIVKKIPSDDMTAAKMHFLETTQSIMHNIVCIIVA